MKLVYDHDSLSLAQKLTYRLGLSQGGRRSAKTQQTAPIPA